MTKDQYLRMCEQTGQEIDWEKCPPDINDFPESTLTTLTIFNELGDRMYPEIGYIGKDYTTLELLFKLHYIDSHTEKEWSTDLLLFLDAHMIKQSQQSIKAAHDKVRR
jgi:hypothetical protein